MSRTHHIFPYDPRHLGQNESAWIESQVQRWPLASVVKSRFCDEASVHFIGAKSLNCTVERVAFHCHSSPCSGPQWWEWGDDWSAKLEQAIRAFSPEDLCIIHLDSYWAAIRAHWCARHCRVVIVQHGKGFPGAHIRRADAVVTLRAESTGAVLADGYPHDRLIENIPTINRTLFARRERTPDGVVRMGAVGVVSRLKGTGQIVETADALRAAGVPFTLDIVGTGPAEEVTVLKRELSDHPSVNFLGYRSSAEVAELMARWNMLLHPSFTEGMSIAVMEGMATGLPVVGVAGVHSALMLRQHGFYAPERAGYARFVVENHRHIITNGCCSDLPVDHSQGARLWEDLQQITRLNAAPIRASQLERWTRSKPLRKFIANKRGLRSVVRALRRQVGSLPGASGVGEA